MSRYCQGDPKPIENLTEAYRLAATIHRYERPGVCAACVITCAACYGQDCEIIVWSNANTDEVTSDAGVSFSSDSEAYCPDCGEHGTLTPVEDIEEACARATWFHSQPSDIEHHGFPRWQRAG